MMPNGSPLAQALPQPRPSVSTTSASNSARLMHHHLPAINNLNFSPHDLIQAHHAMQSISRQHFNQFRMNEERWVPVPSLPFHQLPPLPPKNHNLMPPPPVPSQIQMKPPPHHPPLPSSTMSRVSSSTVTTTTSSTDNSNIHSIPYMPEITLEKNIPKEYVEELLREGKATVILETGKRTRSDVWMYMGRVKIGNSGLLCQDVVACAGCNMVYLYKSKSQGTSTLRHHKCHLVFQMLQEKERQKLLEMEQNPDFKKQLIQKNQQFKQLYNGELITELLNQPLSSSSSSSSSSSASSAKSKSARRNSTQDNFNLPWNPTNWPKGEGRHQQRELTPEGEERKPVMPTPPPLKEHIMNSPSPQSVHPVSLHQTTPVSGGKGNGGLVNNVGGAGRGSNSSTGGCASPAPPSSKDSPSQQLLCVRWGNFDSNIVSMFSKLRSQEHFVDVTLWCEGKTIKCHKMILSACSMYFEKLLTEYPNPHPIIFLKDMRFWEIQALVEFMYRGEVSVHQDELQNLLRAAESLQIKGLGSPSNELGMPGNGGGGDAQNSMDEDMSNSTMDMTTSSHNNSSTLLHNHINNNMKDDNGSNSNSSNGHASIHSHLLGAAVSAVTNSNSNNNNHQAPWQKFAVTANAMMGIDLSNHGTSGALSLSSLHSGNLNLPLSLSAGSPQSGSGSQGSGCGQAAKRRKKETPRRIDLPRTAGMPLPAFNSTMGSEIEEDDDAASEDSMAAHERNHVDGLKTEMQQDQVYEDEDCDTQENYDENDQGIQGEDDISSEHGEEMDEDHDGALSLRISNLSDSERMDRERSRKGNPMKKILGIGNNNNNNEGGPQNLIHNVSTGGD